MANPTIPAGTTVTATLSLDQNASGTALLLIGHPEDSDSVGVAPGSSGSVAITPSDFGILRVHVDMNEESDSGQLTVDPGGVSGPVVGDTNEGFVVA